jgi:integrase
MSVKPVLCPAMLHSFKLVMLWVVENRATGGVNTDFDRLRTFFRFVRASRRSAIVKITGADVLNYRAVHRHEGTLRRVRPILRKWHLMGLAGVADAVALLESLRTKDNVKGRAVRTHDPKMGPFTSIEFDGLIAMLDQRVADGTMDASYAVLAYLLIGLGIRPAQCALLKVRDIRCEWYDGRRRYVLRVPQVKQGHRDARAEFRERVLPESLGKLVQDHAERLRDDFIKVLDDPSSAPLLPARVPGAALARGYEYHAVALDLTQGLKTALAKLRVYSERTGEALHTPAIRFRRTFATRAAAAGWNPPAIAEALGHSSTKNVMVYVEAIPDITARIDRAMASEMAPLAQAFAGTLIKDESEAVRGGDPASRIVDARVDRSGKVRNENLRRWRDETKALLEASHVAESDGIEGADRWTQHQTRTLTRVEQIIEVYEDQAVPNGAVIQPAWGSVASWIEQGREERRLLEKIHPDGAEEAVRREKAP